MEIINIYRNLASESFNLLKRHDYIEYSKNSQYLIELFKKAINEINNPDKSNLIKSFDNILNNLMEQIYKNKFYKEHKDLINSYLQAISEMDKEKEFRIIYPKSIENHIKLVSSFKIIEDIKEIESIIVRMNGLERNNHEEITFYNNLYYINLNKNKEITHGDILNLKKRFLSSLVYKLDYGKGLIEDYALQTIYSFIRQFILNNQTEDLNMLLTEIYTANKLSRKNNLEKILTVTFFYFYYVIVKEKDFEQDVKEKALTMLKEMRLENKNIVDIIKKFDMDSIWVFYLELIKEFDSFRWEIIKRNEVKTLNMNYYFQEYFIFLNYIVQPSPYHLDSLNNLSIEELKSLANFFNSDGELLKKLYDAFRKLLGLFVSEQDLSNDVYIEELIEGKIIGYTIVNKYKEKLLIKLEKTKQKEIVSQNIQKDIDEAILEFEKWAFKDFYKETNVTTNGVNNININQILEIESEVDSYDKNVVRIGMDTGSLIRGMLEKRVLDYILDYVIILDLNFRNNNKLSQIVSNLNILYEDYDLDIDTLINAPNYEKKILVFDGDDANIKYETLIDKLNKIEFKENLGQFYLEKSLLELLNIKFNISLRDLDEEEIQKKIAGFKKVNDEYLIPTYTGQIDLKLTESEIIEYVKNKYFFIIVTLTGEVHVLKEKIGCLVRITY